VSFLSYKALRLGASLTKLAMAILVTVAMSSLLLLVASNEIAPKTGSLVQDMPATQESVPLAQRRLMRRAQGHKVGEIGEKEDEEDEAEVGWSGQDFTLRGLGQNLCQYCKKKNNKKNLGQNFEKCFDQEGRMWSGRSVKVWDSRRRSPDCVAPSKSSSPGSVGWAFGVKALSGSATEGVCRCLNKLFKECDTRACLKEKICACPHVCGNTKVDFGCPGSKKSELLSDDQPQPRATAASALMVNAMKLHSTSNSSNIVGTDVDLTVKGKCGSDEVAR